MAFDIFLSSPDVGATEEQAILDALHSGWIAPLGPMVDGFEDDMAGRIGVSHAVALSSGTAALHLALLATGIGKDDIVVTSTMTFAATANAIVYTGARPFFVDVDPGSGCMDPGLLAEALELLRRTGQPVKAVMPVDLLGRAADYTQIEPLVASYDLMLIPDAAEALGATHGGRAAGSFGLAAALSFNGNKIITTSGGGMLLTNDAALASKVRYLATQARQPVIWYEHTDIGYNYRMSNLLAALGRAQLSRLDAMMVRRAALRDRYKAFWADVPGVTIFAGDGDEHDNKWLTSVLVDPAQAGWTSEDLRLFLAEARIESRPLWKPMHLQPVFADAAALITGSSQRLFETGLTLPSGSVLTDQEHNRVFEVLVKFLESRQ
ncbi:MAG: DegT/DnrJ/EryC1/StrS family aminotransferase [Propionibacteriaceae bacterium]|nr:DegT/DnrJ/EryC1/StrS family aminotransferase [Propionibacteriaceae bacterium]